MKNKKALRKDFYMEIKKSLNRFLSICMIVALGVAFFSGVRASKPDMHISADKFYDDKNFMDIRVLSTLGFTKDDVEQISKVKGVEKIMPSYSKDFICNTKDLEMVVKTFSQPDKLNKLKVEQGRLIKNKTECFVDSEFLKESGYNIGDTISLKSGTKDDIGESLNRTEFTIVGAGSTPSYLSLDRGSSTIGNGNVDFFIVLPKESYEIEAFTEVYVTTDNGKEYTAYTKEYNNYVKKIKKNIEKIADARCEIRYNEVKLKANEKIDEGKVKIKDAKKELKKAKEKIKNAKNDLDDGKKEIKENEKKLTDAKNEIKKNEKTLLDGKTKINTGKYTLKTAKEQIIVKEKELKKSEKTIEKSENLLEISKENIPASELAKSEKELKASKKQIEEGKLRLNKEKIKIEKEEKIILSKEAELNKGIKDLEAAKKKIKTNGKKLEDAKKELKKGEKEYNDGLLKYEKESKKANKKIKNAEKDITDGEQKVADIKYPEWFVLDRGSIQTYVEYGQDADRIGAIGKVFPVIFFLVAALVSLTTMTRMVEEERTQIGTLKALGYSKLNIAAKYILYALFASILGSIIGFIIGQKLLPLVIINAYGILYNNLPKVIAPINLYYSVTSTLIAVLCTTIATIFACYKELSAMPAVLMRPESPKAGKRVLLEKVTFIWKRLNFSYKSTIRNLFRYKKRFFMTVLGIGACMSLIIVGYGLKDSISAIGTLQFGEIRIYSSTIGINEDAKKIDVKELEEKISNDNRIKHSMYAYETAIDVGNAQLNDVDLERNANLVVPDKSNELSNYIILKDRLSKEKYDMQKDGVIITEKLAKILKIKVGDNIYLKDGETKKVKMKVIAIAENYFLHYIYISKEAYEKAFSNKLEYNEILTTNIKDDKTFEDSFRKEYLTYKGVSMVSFISEISNRVLDMLKSMDIVIYVLVLSAGMLAFVVLYNLNNININERKRELATIKVLGFYDNEVAQYVYRENMFLTLIGMLVGIVMGIALHRFVISTVEIDMLMFGRIINLKSYIYSIVLTAVFSLIVNGAMYLKLKKIDMIESLKSVE